MNTPNKSDTLPAGFKPWDNSSAAAPADWEPGNRLWMSDGQIQMTTKRALIMWGHTGEKAKEDDLFTRWIKGYEPRATPTTVANDFAESMGVPLKLSEARPAHPDLNQFLRRADVEALLDAKIMHCDERIATGRAKILDTMDTAEFNRQAQKIGEAINHRSALTVAKRHLDTLDQFTLVDGFETNEAGISELRDREGKTLFSDGRRQKTG